MLAIRCPGVIWAFPILLSWLFSMNTARLLLAFSSFICLSFSSAERKAALRGSSDDQNQRHRLGIGIGVGLFALLVVAFTAYLGTRKKTPRKEAKSPNSTKTKPSLWRRRRQRRIRRHLNNRLNKGLKPKATTAVDDEEETRHLTSRYANPKNFIIRRTIKKEMQVATFFRNHRMKRCARRATARERARVRLHSRAHDRKLRALGRVAKSRHSSPQPAEPEDIHLDVDCQRRLKSKFASEKYFPQATEVAYWKEKPIIPAKEVQPKDKGKGKSKEKEWMKSKEIVAKEEKPTPKITEVFVPSQKKLNILVKKMKNEVEEKRLTDENKKGADFNWPISLEMMYEQLPANYPKVDKLEEMITGWAQLGVFRLETQARGKRPTTMWDYAAMASLKSTMTPSRVKLNAIKWHHESDWINASYFGPPDDSQRFICSPAPDKSWDYDYWTMLVDHNVKCIVQLNNWDYRRPIMNQKEYFIPFERQHYVSSQSKTVRISSRKNIHTKEKESKSKTAETIVSQIEEYTKWRKEYKLGRGRKKEIRNPRRRLSVKRKPAVEHKSKEGGKPKKKEKKGRGRRKGGREKTKLPRGSAEKKETKSTTKEAKTTSTAKQTTTNSTEKKRSTNSKDKEKKTSPSEGSGDRAERRKARKLRRKLRRGMRRIREDGSRPEIFIRKLSVCYLFPEPSTQDENNNPQLSVKPCNHSNKLNYWRIITGATPDDAFMVRATLLRVVCRQKNVNYKMVHFQVFNLDPYQPPDFARYKCLIQLVNKIAGTVSVVSEHGMSRGPTFCLSAVLLQQLKAGQLPDPLKLYSQMQVDRPGCLFRPHGFFVALRTMLEYIKQHQKHFKQKPDILDKLLTDVKVAMSLKRF